MARRLTDAGVSRARGFSLNVSNFNWTTDEVAYGSAISDEIVGQPPFVVDTSRSGLGPSTDPSDRESWCNPPGRALGTPPTADTGNPRVDAFFWVKRPGESDGTCKGGPSAGAWWSEYAYGLADRAPWASDGSPGDGPVVGPTGVGVSGIEYATNGGRWSDRHLNVAVTMTDGTSPLPDATVTIDVYRDGMIEFSRTGTTDSSGKVTFGWNNHADGCYTTGVTLVQTAGTTIADPDAPTNSYAKGTSCP